MADPVTLAAILRSGQAGAPAATLGGEDQQQAAITLAALARAGLLNSGDASLGGIDYGAPRPAFAGSPSLGEAAASMPAYNQPGYRPTSGIAIGPQSAQEASDLADEGRGVGMAAEVSGMAPLYRSGKAASEGRPLEAAGNAAVAAMPYRPAAALGALGATYGAALGADLLPGMVGTPEANAQGRSRNAKAPAPPPSVVMPGLTPEQQAEYDRARRKVESGDFGSGAERRMLEETMRDLRKVSNDSVSASNAAKTSLDAQKKQKEQAEYDRRVANAERIRDEELARGRRFQDTNVGKLFDATGGYAPAVAGGVTGALSRMATGGGRNLYNYLLPAAEGGAAGALTYNIPLAYDAFLTPVENPERRAYSAFARELPPTHPERQRWADYAESLPEANPVRRNASQEFYDPARMAERMIVGTGEGILGGIAGSSAVRTGARTLPSGRSPAGPSPSSTPPSPAAPPPTPTLQQRRYDPSYSVPENAPVAPGEVETWVSPAGRNLLTRDPSGRWRNESGSFATPPAQRRNWRRISSAEGAEQSGGQTMAEFLRG